MMYDTPGVVYLLHFDKKYKHAGHYLGWTNNLQKRLQQHKDGTRERCVLTHVLKLNGIGWKCVRTWEGTRARELTIKSYKNNRRLCPVCDANAAQRFPDEK